MHVSKHVATDSGRQVNIACKIFAVFALSAQPQPGCSRDVQLQVLGHVLRTLLLHSCSETNVELSLYILVVWVSNAVWESSLQHLASQESTNFSNPACVQQAVRVLSLSAASTKLVFTAVQNVCWEGFSS